MKRVILVFLFINNITCILIPKQLLNIPENINFLSQNIAMFHPRDMEPEGRMTTTEIIQYVGFPAETHTVTTDDGYILEMHRIPSNESQSNSGKLPVLLLHGFVCSSAVWIFNLRHNSLGFMLADGGYDVWLGNLRGNIYSRRHKTLTPEQHDFWKFSWDEMAAYDLPSMINYMLKETGHKQITYIGHSMGSTAALALLATKPEYNDKIHTAFVLAPITLMNHLSSPIIKPIAYLHKPLMWLYKAIGVYEFVWRNDFINKLLAEYVCYPPIDRFCIELLFAICGEDWPQFNRTRLPVYLSQFPVRTSLYTADHLAQVITRKKWQHYDWGSPLENLAKYGQINPPLYDVRRITTRVAVFYGLNDTLSAPEDAQWLLKSLKNVVGNYRVGENWAHMDYMWAKDLGKQLPSKIFEILKK